MKADKTPREGFRSSPYKRTPTKPTPEPEAPRDGETRQSEPYRLTFFPPHKGKTLEELEQEGNGRVIDWIKKNLGAKYPDLKEVLEKWERDGASRQPAAVVARYTTPTKEARTDAGPATQRPALPDTATPQVPPVLPRGISTPVTTPPKATTLRTRADGSSPSARSKSTATGVFSGALSPVQPPNSPSPTSSEGTLSESTLQDKDYELGDYEDGDYEEDDCDEDGYEDDGYCGDPEFDFYRMEYGKYKDQWLKDVPDSYIQWLLNAHRCSNSLYYTLRNFIRPTKTVPGIPDPKYAPPELALAPPNFRDERTKFPLKIMGSDATEYFTISATQLSALRLFTLKPVSETKPTKAQY
jgi:hypothetical protein